jgi:hypothetical protein
VRLEQLDRVKAAAGAPKDPGRRDESREGSPREVVEGHPACWEPP